MMGSLEQVRFGGSGTGLEGETPREPYECYYVQVYKWRKRREVWKIIRLK